MKTRYFLLVLFLALTLMALVISCSKEEEEETYKPPTYVIEGHLYRDCSMEPVVGKKLYLIESVPHAFFGFQEKGIDLSCVTDSTGYFKFTMVGHVVHQLTIGYYVGTIYNSIIDDIPRRTSFIDYDLFLYPTINIEVYLHVTNPYTEFDTLVINDFKTKKGFRRPGPFESGFAFRTDSVYFIDLSMRDDFYGMAWYKAPYVGDLYWATFGIKQFCDNTIVLTLDIE